MTIGNLWFQELLLGCQRGDYKGEGVRMVVEDVDPERSFMGLLFSWEEMKVA